MKRKQLAPVFAEKPKKKLTSRLTAKNSTPNSWFSKPKNQTRHKISSEEFMSKTYSRMKKADDRLKSKRITRNSSVVKTELVGDNVSAKSGLSKHSKNRENNKSIVSEFLKRMEKTVAEIPNKIMRSSRAKISVQKNKELRELELCTFSPEVSRKGSVVSLNDKFLQKSIPNLSVRKDSAPVNSNLPVSNWISLSGECNPNDSLIHNACFQKNRSNAERTEDLKQILKKYADELAAEKVRSASVKSVLASQSKKKASENPIPGTYNYLFSKKSNKKPQIMQKSDWFLYKEECILALQKKKRKAMRRVSTLKSSPRTTKKQSSYIDNTLLKIKKLKKEAESFKYSKPSNSSFSERKLPGIFDYLATTDTKGMWKGARKSERDSILREAQNMLSDKLNRRR